MYRMLLVLLASGLVIAGCSAPKAPANAPAPAATPAVEDADGDESGAVTELENRDLGPYKVRAIYTGDLSAGHFNFYVTGGKAKAVRSWVGDESATGVMVTKANLEDDHYCAHVEMPATIPDSAMLWYEIESEDGTTEKASISLKAKP